MKCLGRYILSIICILTVALLVACGGGGLTPETNVDTNNIEISAGLDQIIQVGYTAKLNARILKNENLVASYAWKQLSGEDIGLQGADTAAAWFDPTQVVLDPLVFELTVTSQDGKVYTDRTQIKIIPTSYNNFVTTQVIDYQNGEITRCISTEYSDFGGQLEHYEYINPGQDGICFTADDSGLVANKSFILEVESENKGLRRYMAEDLCEKVELEANYPSFVNTLSTLESCDSDTVVKIIVEERLMTSLGELEYLSFAYGSRDTIWPGHPSNPASVENPVKYLAFDSIFGTDGHTYELFVFNDLRGEDGIYMTEDDVLSPYRYILYFFDDNGRPIYALGYDVGPDRVMQTGDDFIVALTVENYDENGLISSFSDYDSPGPDNDWLTFDDNNLVKLRVQKFLPLFPLITND